jgi:CBS domain-containing protein
MLAEQADPTSIAAHVIRRTSVKRELLAADVMVPGVPTVAWGTPLRQAASILSAHPGRALVVLDIEGEPIGTITEAALSRALDEIAECAPALPRSTHIDTSVDMAPVRAS